MNMEYLKICLFLSSIAYSSGGRIQFRQAKRTPFIGQPILNDPLLKTATFKYHLPHSAFADLDPSNPWAPKIVKIEVSHEVLHEVTPTIKSTIKPKYLDDFESHVGDADVKPIHPHWFKKESGIWSDDKSNVRSEPEDDFENEILPSRFPSHNLNDGYKPVLTKPELLTYLEHGKAKSYTKQVYGFPSEHKHNSHDLHSHDHYEKGYSFNYGVASKITGDMKSHEETKKDGVVKGKYVVKEADGTTREVHYTAGKNTGFSAVVLNHGYSQDTGHHSGTGFHDKSDQQ